MPVFTALLAAGFLGERHRPLGVAGIGLGFLGAATMATAGGRGWTFDHGAAMVLAAAVAQAAFFVLQKPLLASYRPVELMASNTWVREDGAWRMVNHQAAHIPGGD